MANKKIVVEFLGDSKDLKNAIDDVDGKSSKLGSTLGKVGKAAALGLGAGLVIGGAALVKMTQGAIEDEAAQAKLAKQLENSAGATKTQIAATEDWISAQGLALGVTDDELRPALSKLVTATGDVGEAQKLAALAMDVSAGSGKSLEAVSLALMKARNGEIGGLSKLGIATKNAAGETLTFEQVTKNMADTFGGQAATQANTLEGKMDRLKLIMAEAGETIGAKLIPVVTQMADWFLKKGLPAIEVVTGWIQDNLIPALSGMAEWVGKNKEILLPLAGVLAGVAAAIGVIAAVTKVWAAVQAAMNVVLLANPIGIIIVAIAGLVAGLVIAWKSSETFREVVTGVLNTVKNVALAVAGFFKDTLPKFFQDAWDKAKKWTADGADKIVDWVTALPAKILNALVSLHAKLGNLFLDAMAFAKEKVVSVGGAIVDWLAGYPERVKNNLSGLVGAVGGLFRDAMVAGKERVVDIGATIVEWIAGIPGKLLNKVGEFTSAGKALLQGFVDGMKNAAGVIEGIAGNVWNTVRGLLNGAIAKINAALSFTISLPLGKSVTINPPDIPALAKGGLVTRPTLALIGEDGPEAVVPLSRKHNPGGTMPGMGGGDDRPLLVQLVLDGKVIEEALVRRSRRTGRPLAFSTSG